MPGGHALTGLGPAVGPVAAGDGEGVRRQSVSGVVVVPAHGHRGVGGAGDGALASLEPVNTRDGAAWEQAPAVPVGGDHVGQVAGLNGALGAAGRGPGHHVVGRLGPRRGGAQRREDVAALAGAVGVLRDVRAEHPLGAAVARDLHVDGPGEDVAGRRDGTAPSCPAFHADHVARHQVADPGPVRGLAADRLGLALRLVGRRRGRGRLRLRGSTVRGGLPARGGHGKARGLRLRRFSAAAPVLLAISGAAEGRRPTRVVDEAQAGQGGDARAVAVDLLGPVRRAGAVVTADTEGPPADLTLPAYAQVTFESTPLGNGSVVAVRVQCADVVTDLGVPHVDRNRVPVGDLLCSPLVVVPVEGLLPA